MLGGGTGIAITITLIAQMKLAPSVQTSQQTPTRGRGSCARHVCAWLRLFDGVGAPQRDVFVFALCTIEELPVERTCLAGIPSVLLRRNFLRCVRVLRV